MKHEPERRGYGLAVLAVLLIATLSYLSFAAVQGEFGIVRNLDVRAEERDLERELSGLRSERDRLSNQVVRLSTETLDLEMLEERARRQLRYVHADEIEIDRGQQR